MTLKEWCIKNNKENLLNEWDYKKNGNFSPDNVSYGSHKNIWWEKWVPHPITNQLVLIKWQAIIRNRIRCDNCPYLSGKEVLQGFNDLATINPTLAKEWHPTKNGDLKPTDVTVSSEKKVWWQKWIPHPITNQLVLVEWQAVISSRNLGVDCPYLSGKEVLQGFNDLATVNPILAKEWHPTKNGDLKPTDVTVSSGKKVWWQITYKNPFTNEIEIYEWQAKIANRYNGNSCPQLSASKIERFIASILNKWKVSYKREKCFAETGKCRFDFYLDKYNIIIEPDGEQHFIENSFHRNSNTFQKSLSRDNLKNNFCLEQNIPILRIPYIFDVEKNKDKIVEFLIYFLRTNRVPDEILNFYKQYELNNYYKIAKKLNSQNSKQ